MIYKGKRVRLTEAMATALDYALKSPTRWHEIGYREESKKAVASLAAAGLVEIREHTNQFKVTP